MQRLEVMLEGCSFSADDVSQNQIKKILNQYFEQAEFDQCIKLYNLLMDQWQGLKTPNLLKMENYLSAELALQQIQEAHIESLLSLLKSEFDKIHGKYNKKQASDENRAKVELDLINLFMRFLVSQGKDRIKKNSRKLSLLFHPDKKSSYSNSIKWLEGFLGEEHCFKLIEKCVERIMIDGTDFNNNFKRNRNPDAESDKHEKAAGIMQHIVTQSISADTFSERLFYRSLLNMIDELRKNHYTATQFESKLATIFSEAFPFLSSIYCLSFFSSGLFYLLLASYGLNIQSNPSNSSISATMASRIAYTHNLIRYSTSTLLVALCAENLKLSHYTLNGMFKALNFISASSYHDSNVGFEGKNYHFLPIKFISLYLEKYISLQQSQWLAGYREGSVKVRFIKAALDKISEIDNQVKDPISKLDQIEALLATIKNQPGIFKSGYQAIHAIESAINEIQEAQYALLSDESKSFYYQFHQIIEPLNNYIAEQNKQWAASMRKGASKSGILNEFVDEAYKVRGDKNQNSEQKLADIQRGLEGLKSNNYIISSGSKAIEAIDSALKALQDNPQQPAACTV